MIHLIEPGYDCGIIEVRWALYIVLVLELPWILLFAVLLHNTLYRIAPNFRDFREFACDHVNIIHKVK